jgi:hypothetical protein
MTSQPDVDRALEDWLAQGPSRLPDRVITVTVDQLDCVSNGGTCCLRGENA